MAEANPIGYPYRSSSMLEGPARRRDGGNFFENKQDISALTSERDYQWRVVASDGVVQSPFSIDTFFAIDTIAPDGITDLAAGPAPSSPVLVTAPAVDSSGDRSDAKSKEKATDGDPLTFWSTPARAVAQHEFITMDTASVHRIGRVRVLSRDRGRLFPEDLEVQVSDDNVDFTTVHQVFGLPTTTSTWHTFDFAPAQGRYVRMTITKARKTSGTYKVHIAEIQIYESPIVTGSLSLGWTAPGDNGSLGTAASYALKWSLSPIDSGNFGSATPVTLSPPLPPGSIETATVTGLPDETRLYFAITTSDEVPLTSALSNVADAATLEFPPAPVNDLAASNPTGTTVDLTWSAVADVGPDPQAGSYDLRFSTGPIDDDNFSSATPLPGAGALVAKTAGQLETFTATGLPVETLIYFAVKVVDKLGNTSPADTGAEPSAMTLDTSAPDAITDLAAGPAPSSPVLVTAPAVDSSGDRSDAKSKEKATDGDPLTIWSTPARAVAQHEFITMDTASVHRIGRVRVLSRDRGRLFPEDLEVQVSDDNVSFTTVHQVFGLPTTTSTWHTFDFAPAQGRYVRMTITKARKTSGTYKVHIAEIQIYESPIVTGSLSLGWTAPGDNGSLGTAASYALKWSLSPIDSGNFGSATPVTLSPPLPPGSIETATVTGLPDETKLYFAITTSDEVPLTSALSNVADAATLGFPPAPVNDLAASNPTGTTVDLTWSAVADVGPDPQAGSYDLRFSTGPIDDDNFSSATPLPGAGALVAKTAGQLETFTATGLPVETLIYFAVKVVDKLGNTSPADTGAEPSAMTLDTSAPDAITDLAAGPAPSSPVLVTAPAVDSSGDRSDARSKEKATDGDPLTIWSTPARAVAQHEFITMDTASVHRIGRVRVLSRDRGRLFPEDLEVQVSDDNVSFTTVHQVFGLPTTTSTWHTFDFAPAQGRYVRMTITKARKTSGTYKVHIAEIQIYESPIVTGSLSLGWTAPGDNGSLGTAASYALKWSLSPIDSGNFGSATPVTLSPPLPPGSLETATLTGLPDETRLYFAITTSDEVPLTSALSNVADAVTPADHENEEPLSTRARSAQACSRSHT